MICGTLADQWTDCLTRTRLPRVRLTLRRLGAGRPEWVLTFAGEVDTRALDGLLQLIERLVSIACDTWQLEMVAEGLAPEDARRLAERLEVLLRFDVRHRLVLVPRRAAARAARHLLH